jgi:hypothetical protein
MLKLDKKGVVWETLADVFLAGIILFIGTSLYFYLSGLQQENVNVAFSKKITELNTQDIVQMYMKADVDGRKICDSVTEAYFGDSKNLAKDLDSVLNQVYSSKVCWVLYKDNKEWIKKNICKNEAPLLNSSTVMPIPDRTSIDVRLFVKGYAK